MLSPAAVLITTVSAVILTMIAWTDWHSRRIPNSLIALLGVLATLHLAAAHANLVVGLSAQEIAINLALLLLVLPGYLKNQLGAGDVKLIIVLSFLWQPSLLWPAFAVGSIGLGLAAVSYRPLLAGHDSVNHGLQDRIPLGTGIVLGALCLMLLQGIWR